jgi:succinoglycan biosynthesis protein ExoO
MDTVSAIIPAFNAASTIREAIDSVLSQSHGALEVVVCDDASTDGTARIVSSIGDDRVLLIRNATNRGSGFSRDRAIAAASGQWVAMLDADDAWLPRRLSRMLDAAKTAPESMIFDDIMECDSRPSLTPRRRLRGPEAFGASGEPIDVAGDQWASSKRLLIKPMIRTDTLRRLGLKHTTRRYAEDTEFFFNLVATRVRLRYVPEASYLYRRTRMSASSVKTRHSEMLRVLEEAKSKFAEDAAMLNALHARIRHERHLRAYFDFLWSAKSGEMRRAARLVLANPSIMAEFASRSLADISFRLG